MHTPGPWQLTGHGTIEPAGKRTQVAVVADFREGEMVYRGGDFDQTQQELRANRQLIAAAPELLAALEAATREILADRDCLYDSITDGEGNITDPDDGEGLAELDALLDRCNAAIAKAKVISQ